MNDLTTLFNSVRRDPFFLGFDRVFDLLTIPERPSAVGYPPYNVIKTGDHNFTIEVALAGFSEKDLEVTVKDGLLTVAANVAEKKSNGTAVHQGIARRSFSRSWTLADTIEVVDASFDNGMLTISLREEVPERLKPRVIKINSAESASEAEFLTEDS